MAGYTFAYTAFSIPPSDPFPSGRQVYRPLLVARLKVPATGATVRCLVWPDSGADSCVFPLSFAQALGIDPVQMRMHMTGGVGSVANATYYAEVHIEIPVGMRPALRFPAFAGFTPGLEAQGVGLLGQVGFFEALRVSFDYRARTFTLVER